MTAKTKKMTKKEACAEARKIAGAVLQRTLDNGEIWEYEPKEVREAAEKLAQELRN